MPDTLLPSTTLFRSGEDVVERQGEPRRQALQLLPIAREACLGERLGRGDARVIAAGHHARPGVGGQEILLDDGAGVTAKLRSEEHTSELQSLMRNSYAVFCL